LYSYHRLLPAAEMRIMDARREPWCASAVGKERQMREFRSATRPGD
jgi:hypothetical protein